MVAAVALIAAASWLGPQEFETVGGKAFSLQSALARGPVVMVFRSSWLPDASSTIPTISEIERTAAEHGWPGAIVIFQDDNAAAAQALGGDASGFPKLLDRRGALLRQFQVTRAPSLLIVDRDGSVISRSGLDPTQVRAALQALAQRSLGSH